MQKTKESQKAPTATARKPEAGSATKGPEARQARTDARTWRKRAVQIVATTRSASGATHATMVATAAQSAAAAILRATRAEAPATTRFHLVGPTAKGATPVREALRQAAEAAQRDPAAGLPGKAKPRKNAPIRPEKSAANFYICAREASGTEPSDGARESKS